MSQEELQSTESTWIIIRFFHFIYTKVYNAYVWLFPERYVIYEDNEAGLLLRRHLENKDFLGHLSSGWVELHFGFKTLIIVGVSLAAGLIGFAISAPTLCVLFALSMVVGIHTLLVAHEQHRRNSAKSMLHDIEVTQKDLETQQEALELATKCAHDVTEQLSKHLDALNKGVGEITQEVVEIKQQKEGLVEVIAEVDLLAKAAIDAQNKLSVKIDESIEEMSHLDAAVDKGVESAHQFSKTVSTFETSVDKFANTQKQHAQAVAKFGLFVAKMGEENPPEEALEYDAKTNMLLSMLDDANARMERLNAEAVARNGAMMR